MFRIIRSIQITFASTMSVIFLLIIISITVASVFLIGFLWAVRSGQFEDDYAPSVRILFDEESPAGNAPSKEKKTHINQKNSQPETQD